MLKALVYRYPLKGVQLHRTLHGKYSMSYTDYTATHLLSEFHHNFAAVLAPELFCVQNCKILNVEC